jgi:hypothetical protein
MMARCHLWKMTFRSTVMTKRDYIVLANALKNARPLVGGTVHIRTIKSDQWAEDVAAIAMALYHQNPRFNMSLWLKEIGVGS